MNSAVQFLILLFTILLLIYELYFIQYSEEYIIFIISLSLPRILLIYYRLIIDTLSGFRSDMNFRKCSKNTEIANFTFPHANIQIFTTFTILYISQTFMFPNIFECSRLIDNTVATDSGSSCIHVL